jgi:uncharacterized protein
MNIVSECNFRLLPKESTSFKKICTGNEGCCISLFIAFFSFLLCMKLYLDIETTGLSKYDSGVTVVGALKSKEFVQLVNGKNLEKYAMQELFDGVNEVVSFNGSRFDIPFLEHHFPGCIQYKSHKDLMICGWKQGYYGGLKSVEKELGIARKVDCNGLEAVRLWKKHLSGCKESLKKLLHYNQEDVLNLKVLEKKLDILGK